MTSPAVSVIIPLYNSEKYIKKCISSLINQTCSCKYEIVVVNDGSTDNSVDIINSMKCDRCDIRIINQPNSGVSVARNTGVANAMGEYIAFVDSDDYVSPDYIKLLYDSACEHDSDMACCNYRNVTNEKGGGADNFFVHSVGVFDSGKILKAALHDITVRSYLWNKLYRRSLFTENNILFPVGMSFEDFAVMPRLIYHCKKISFIKDSLYYYVHHEGSITGTITKKAIWGYVQAYALLREFMEEKNIFEHHKFTYFILKQKISVTVYGMLLRCWWNEPKTAHVLSNYLKARKFMNIYSSDKYYFSKKKQMELYIS